MRTVTVKVTFDAAHRVLGHTGKCRFLHGHTYVAEVTFIPTSGVLNELGFVEDFGLLKNIVKGWIDSFWDHNIILNIDDPLLELRDDLYEKIFAGSPPYICSLGRNPTAEVLAEELFETIKDNLKTKGLFTKVTEVKIRETENNCATFMES